MAPSAQAAMNTGIMSGRSALHPSADRRTGTSTRSMSDMEERDPSGCCMYASEERHPYPQQRACQRVPAFQACDSMTRPGTAARVSDVTAAFPSNPIKVVRNWRNPVHQLIFNTPNSFWLGCFSRVRAWPSFTSSVTSARRLRSATIANNLNLRYPLVHEAVSPCAQISGMDHRVRILC